MASRGLLNYVSHNPLIEGLFRMLPVEGAFPPEMQRRWLEAAKVNLALVYGKGQEEEPEAEKRS